MGFKLAKKMGYASPFVGNEDLEEKIETNFTTKILKMHFEIHIVHNHDAFEVLRKRPKKDNSLYLYVRKKNDKKIKNTKVTKFDLSGIRFDDIEPIGVTLSKNVLNELMAKTVLGKDIIHDLAEWMNINKEKYELDKSDIVLLLEEDLRLYDTFINYEPPNALELINQIFLMCIRLGVVDLSNTAGYISEEVMGAIADFIRKAKLGQETWNPNIAELQYKDIPFGSTKYDPIISSDSAMTKSFVLLMDSLLIGDSKELNLPKHDGSPEEINIADFITNGIIGSINDIILWFKNIIADALKSIVENVDLVIKSFNAFIIGFYNGIIEFIAGIVDGVGGLIGLLNYQNQVAITKATDKFLSELSWSKIGEIISNGLKDLFDFLIGDEPYKNAYEFGLSIPKIFELALEIIGFVKGVGRIASKFPKAKDFINEQLDKIAKNIKLPSIDLKLLESLRNKGITLETSVIIEVSMNSTFVQPFKKVFQVKYNEYVLKTFKTKVEAEDYLKKINNDEKFFDIETKITKIRSYGLKGLSKIAITFRKTQKYPKHPGNIAVFEFIDKNGKLQRKAFSTLSPEELKIRELANSPHAEILGMEWLKKQKIPNENVKKIYSELEPCSLKKSQCKAKLKTAYPKAELEYTFEYPGEENASIDMIQKRKASIKEREDNLEKLIK